MIRKSKTSVNTREALAEVFQKLAAKDCDPIAELADLAMSVNTPLDTRVGILKELAHYTAPKRRAVDVTASGSEGIVVKIIKYSRDTVGQCEKMMDPEALAEERRANASVDETMSLKELEEQTGGSKIESEETEEDDSAVNG